MSFEQPGASDGFPAVHAFRPLDFDNLSGRVVEFSGWKQSAGTSLAAALIRSCRERGRYGAWISTEGGEAGSIFFPPDFSDAGIDCLNLPVIFADSSVDGFAVAEKLLRTGAFGLIVIDLTGNRMRRCPAVGRTHALARRFDSLVLCLTRRPPGMPSLDPMIFVRAQIGAREAEGGTFGVTAEVLKDKTGRPGRQEPQSYEAPIGLC